MPRRAKQISIRARLIHAGDTVSMTDGNWHVSEFKAEGKNVQLRIDRVRGGIREHHSLTLGAEHRVSVIRG